MLRIGIDDTGHFEMIAASGSAPLVAALFGAAINAVYKYISAGHPDAGAEFRDSLEAIMASGSVWDSDLMKHAGQGFTIIEFTEQENGTETPVRDSELK